MQKETIGYKLGIRNQTAKLTIEKSKSYKIETKYILRKR